MDQRLTPERIRKPWRVLQHLSEVGMGYKGNGGRTDAAKVMIHDRQVQSVQIGHVARHIEG
jgi:hypothetical protein